MIAAEATPITLRINGQERELWVSPLTDLDILELEQWMRAQVIRSAYESARGLPDAERDLILRVAMQESAGMSFISHTGIRMAASLAGFSRVFWQGIKARHPEITVEQVRENFLDPAKLREANRVFKEQNLDPTKAPPQPGETGPIGQAAAQASH